MEQIEVRNLTFAYQGAEELCLQDISFSVEKGEMVLLIGPSGSGKTTLLKQLKKDYTPWGKCGGEIRFQGELLEKMDERSQAAKIGFVGQNVESANATDKVWHELAFGLESLGYSQSVMGRRVAEITAFFGLEDIYYASVDTLSGGQKQIVALASVMVMEPELLVLDEPTSQLDPVAAGEFLRMLQKINQELGTTIVMTEHRLEETFSLCSRVMVMEQGRLAFDGTASDAVLQLYRQQNCMYKAMPAAARLFMELEKNERKFTEENQIPLNTAMGAKWLKDFCEEWRADGGKAESCCWGNKKLEKSEDQGTGKEKSEKEKLKNSGSDKIKKEKFDYALQAKELWFRYEGCQKDVLKSCNISVEKGKVTALLGGNGTGKSTLLHVLAGHEKDYEGKIRYGSQQQMTVGMLPQNPQAMFAKHTVYEELEVSAKGAVSPTSKMLKKFGLDQLLHRHPFDLSGGEMQKLGLAKLLLADYDILLLDEPGKGMDYAFKEEMGQLLLQLAQQGKTILMVSHDVEFCASFAQRCGLFFDGHVVSLEEGKDFFRQNVFYTTAIRRICKDDIPEAVVFEDVTNYFGVNATEPDNDRKQKIQGNETTQEIDKKDWAFTSAESTDLPEKKAQDEKKQSEHLEKPQADNHQLKKSNGKNHMWVTLFIFLVVMPVTIYIGETFLQHRKYYFISMLLVLEAIAAFFISFEKRKPKTREIMVVATLCAVTVAGRAAFYMVPNVKPMAALVILSGVSLGGEIGFLVGAISMLVSNIFFGQGPWTPWQMFAMGLLGLAAGLVFRQETALTGKKRLGICIFGFLSVIVLYGGIMNPASVIMYQDNVNLEMIVAACGLGLPFDLIHAASTFVFLLVGAGPMLRKLERVKRKYGF